MSLILFISLLICLLSILVGIIYFRIKSIAFLIFLFFNMSMGVIIFSLWLNTLNLSEDNILLNFTSLLYFVACITIAPLFYLYTKAVSLGFSGEKSSPPFLKHLIPTIVLLIINIFSFFYFQKASPSHVAYPYIENIMMYSNALSLYFILLIQICFYVPFSIRAYFQYRQKVVNLYSFEDGVSLKWIQGYIAGFILFIFFIYIIQFVGNVNKIIFGLSLNFYLLFAAYFAFQQERELKKILNSLEKITLSNKVRESDLKENKSENNNEIIIVEDLKETEILYEIKETDQDNETLELISVKIQSLMELEKIYLDKELSLAKLALLLDSNTKYVSNSINYIFQKNFTAYVNKFRVEESIRLLSSSQADIYTLETIAELSGFKSRSVFISAFKKETGKTPSQFRKEINLNE